MTALSATLAGGVFITALCTPMRNGPDFPRVLPSPPAGVVKLWIIPGAPMSTAEANVLAGGSWCRRTNLQQAWSLAIQHGHQLILVDPGFRGHDAAIMHTFGGTLFFLSTQVEDGPTIMSALSQRGLDPKRISDIYVTHPHFDHLTSAVDFPHVPLHLTTFAAKALSNPWHPVSWSFPREMREDLLARIKPFECEAQAYETFARRYDLFGDGTVVFVDSPGHSAGDVGVFVNLRSGRRFYFTGDTAWTVENYRQPVRKGLLSLEFQGNDESLWRLNALHRKAPEIVIVPGHASAERDLAAEPQPFE